MTQWPRPVVVVMTLAKEQDEIPNNFTIFSASKLNQISSGLKEANHGIFSYYLIFVVSFLYFSHTIFFQI